MEQIQRECLSKQRQQNNAELCFDVLQEFLRFPRESWINHLIIHNWRFQNSIRRKPNYWVCLFFCFPKQVHDVSAHVSSWVSINISEPTLTCNQDLIKWNFYESLTADILTGSVTINTCCIIFSKCLQLADNSKEHIRGQNMSAKCCDSIK